MAVRIVIFAVVIPGNLCADWHHNRVRVAPLSLLICAVQTLNVERIQLKHCLHDVGRFAGILLLQHPAYSRG